MDESFDYHYTSLLARALSQDPKINVRTGVKTRSIRGGVSFSVELGDGLLPVPSLRKVFPRSAAAEVAWYLQGTQDPEFIMRYAPKMWQKFRSPESGLVDNAYGYRWRRKFGRDQIVAAIVALKKDPSNRQVYVGAWDPATDGLGNTALNVPCPVGFTFNIQNDELHSTLMLRSSDLFVGLPYDVMGHALLMDIMAASIDRSIMLGVMHVTLADAHIYETHMGMIEKGLMSKARKVAPQVVLPGQDLGHVMIDPDGWVEQIRVMSAQTYWPEYDPKPDVVA